MLEKLNKKHTLYLIIVGLGLIILILSVLLLTHQDNSGASTEQTGATATVSSSSSSTKKYVEGRDYTVTYSNKGIVSKALVDATLQFMGLDHQTLNMEEDNGGFSKFELFYNESKDVMIEKLYFLSDLKKKDTGPSSIVAYDLRNKKQIDGYIGRLYYDNMPLVYTWTNNLTK
jgi:hypothetical protein